MGDHRLKTANYLYVAVLVLMQGLSLKVSKITFNKISGIVKLNKSVPAVLLRASFVGDIHLQPQSHIHDFGPGRATVHSDLASR